MAPDLVGSVAGVEDRIIGPRGPGDCEFLVDFDFERLYSVAEDQLVLRQDVQGPDLGRWTLEQFDGLPIKSARVAEFYKGQTMWGSFVGAQAKNGGNENEKYDHKVAFWGLY